MTKSLSIVIQLLCALLPAAAKRVVLRSVLKWEIGARTTIGFSIILADQVKIGSDVRIRHFNMFRGLRLLEIGDGAIILNFNDSMAGREPGWPASLRIGRYTDVTSHHYFDCSGGIVIGDNSVIGGRGSQLWTHYRVNASELQPRSLSIGSRVYVCANATLVYCHIPDDSIVGAGAVVTKDIPDDSLAVGNPARVIRKIG